MLDVDDFITEIKATQPRLGFLLSKMVTGINQTAQVLGIDNTGFNQAPHAPQAINVKAANGLAHVTIQDGSPRSRALSYFLEMDTNPNFSAPHVEHLVAGRGRFLSLPNMDDDSNPQSWYFRTYSMNPGSTKRSAHLVFGGTTPMAVDVGGSTALTPLPSTGSGTASTTGQQGGQGFGNDLNAKAETGAIHL